MLPWTFAAALPAHRLPPALRCWLLDSGSLTARLQAVSGGDFRVRVLSQRWSRPRLDEARALGLAPGQYCLIREVVLKGEGQPWVYARSILPWSSVNGPLRYLRQLGNRPLGALLFRDPALRREPIEVAQLPGAHVPVGVLHTAIKDEVWGRRSVFYLQGRPLLVSEIFLPAFEPVAQRSTTASATTSALR